MVGFNPASLSSQLGQTLLLLTGLSFLAFGFWNMLIGTMPRRRRFGLLLNVAALWLFTLAFWRIAPANASLFWARSLIMASLALPLTLLIFFWTYFPERKNHRAIWLILAPLLPIGCVIFFTDLAIKRGLSGEIISGSAWPTFTIFYASVFIAAAIIFLLASRRDQDVDRSALTAVLTGAVVSLNAIFSIVFGVSPLLHNPTGLSWLPIIAFAGGLAIMAMFVIRSQVLVDLRLIGVQAITFLALFLFVADFVAAAESPFEFIYRLVVLLLLLINGIMNIRWLIHETRRLREFDMLQHQLIETNGQLIEADRTKTKFVSFVAHQLKAPIFGVHGYLNMALKGSFGVPPPALADTLKLNVQALDGLIHTVETFLNVTRIEMGKIRLYKRAIVLSELTERATREMEPLAQKKGLALIRENDVALPRVVCDPANLYHAIINMIDNAIKYTASGSVTILTRREGDLAIIEVRDTGIGLSASDRHSLFNIFERGVSAVNLQSRGEGLGLYIAKQFVEAHGGSVFFDSTGSGQGSTFGFRIPIGKMAPEELI